jgi:hypothetical protein
MNIYVSVCGCICIFTCCDYIYVSSNGWIKLKFLLFLSKMFLPSRLKEVNSRSRSSSPFPFVRQPRGYSGLSGQDTSLISRPVEGVNNQSEPGSSSRSHIVHSAVNSVGSWDISMVSTGFCL